MFGELAIYIDAARKDLKAPPPKPGTRNPKP